MQDQVALGALALTQSCQGRHRPRPLAHGNVEVIVGRAGCKGSAFLNFHAVPAVLHLDARTEAASLTAWPKPQQ